MHISSIAIKKFRHLENEKLGPFTIRRATSDLVVFAGPNGSGKSSVLELIGYALSNSYSLNWSLSRTFNDFAFEVGVGLTIEERSIVRAAVQVEIDRQDADYQAAVNEVRKRTDLAPEQLEPLCQQKRQNFLDSTKPQREVVAYLEKHAEYYRAFNFDSGEYAKNPTLQNRIHQHVSAHLKEVLRRSLGFFLKADRTYPQTNFDRRRIFEFENTRRTEHLWTIAYNTSEVQYRDMYEFLVQQRYHYLRDLGSFHHRAGTVGATTDAPVDPLQPYEELLGKLLPGYRFAEPDDGIPSNLYVKIPSGETIPFSDLSSGEKEVFFILSFFIRHNVSNAIIVIDEPELHLHPELSRQLISSMKSIRPGNQIWVATHNPEIIDEAGRDRVIYVTRDAATRKSSFVSGQDEQVAISQLKSLFGLSGYIGVARRLVFVEGNNASQDRKFYSLLFPANSSVKLIPAASSDSQHRLNAAILSILESNLGWMDFFLIRDRDYLTTLMADKYRSHPSGRVFVLQRHEIENYLLDFVTMSEVLADVFNVHKTPQELKSLFHSAAIAMSSDVLRDMLVFRLNLNLRPQDFSLGALLNRQPYYQRDANGTLVSSEAVAATMRSKVLEVTRQKTAEVCAALNETVVTDLHTECVTEVQAALNSDDWISLFPGKELVQTVCKNLGISNPLPLQNSVIKALATHPERIPPDLTAVVGRITA